MTPLEACRAILALCEGFDDNGPTGPKKPYRWETVACMAFDYARAVVQDADEKPAARTAGDERLARALKDLMRAYVGNLENARERILFHGGDCDPVDVMERGDPYLRQAREALELKETP